VVVEARRSAEEQREARAMAPEPGRTLDNLSRASAEKWKASLRAAEAGWPTTVRFGLLALVIEMPLVVIFLLWMHRS
jgi:hypothetical protein